MTTKKYIQPGEKVPLKLTAAERKLILDALIVVGMEYEELLRNTPANQPLLMTLEALEDFAGYIAAEANHCDNSRQQDKLDRIFLKIQKVLDHFTDEEPPQTFKIEDARKAKVVTDQAVYIADWAAKVLVAAEQLGVKKKPLEHFCLAPAQRDVLLLVPGVTKTIKKKLASGESSFNVAEVASMTMALADDLLDGDARKQVAVLLVASDLMQKLQSGIFGSDSPRSSKSRKPRTKPKAQRHAKTVQFRKLSDILKEMSEQLLRNPAGPYSSEAAHVALMFANIAWDETVGLGCPRDGYRSAWEPIEAENPEMWSEFKSNDIDAIIDGLVQYKKKHFSDDHRRILVCGIPEGKIHVEWLAPAAPGVDSKWEMQLYGLVRTGEMEKAVQFLRESKKMTRKQAEEKVAQTVSKLGLV